MSERLRLLLVDDDPVDRVAVRRAIEQGGYASVIDEADSTDEALARIVASAYDCILLDQDVVPASRAPTSARSSARAGIPHPSCS